MSQNAYNQSNSYSNNGGPVQHPMSNQQYAQMAQAQAPPPLSIRPSSGAWNPTDDATLMAARAQGMNWAPIQQAYFPTKTSNACRKRHERLMERRNQDDWDGRKLENLAKHYMAMRREIWSGLAAQTGEKWNVVEAKVCLPSIPTHTPIFLFLNSQTNTPTQCMSQGLKNLQTSARSCARRERLSDPNSNPNNNNHYTSLPNGYENDSGYAEDLELGGDEYEADNNSERSNGSYGYSTHSHHHTGSTGSSMNGNVGGNMGMNGGGMGMGGAQNMMDSRAYMTTGVGSGVGVQYQNQGMGVNANGQRLPSMDMGIDAIINRPSGGR